MSFLSSLSRYRFDNSNHFRNDSWVVCLFKVVIRAVSRIKPSRIIVVRTPRYETVMVITVCHTHFQAIIFFFIFKKSGRVFSLFIVSNCVIVISSNFMIKVLLSVESCNLYLFTSLYFGVYWQLPHCHALLLL